jgi:hypothetical protein
MWKLSSLSKMMASPQRRSLVESVAQALSFAISDPMGHTSWAHSQLFSPCKRHRGAEETRRAATVFDSSAIPAMGVVKYLMRLSAGFRCSDESFIAALIIVDRLLAYDGGRLPLTMRNVHRVFLASLVVVVKYNEDLVYKNTHYAKAGGVNLKEVNRLERTILQALDFDLRIDPEQYKLYEAALFALSGSRSCEEVLKLAQGHASLPSKEHRAKCSDFAPDDTATIPINERCAEFRGSTIPACHTVVA